MKSDPILSFNDPVFSIDNDATALKIITALEVLDKFADPRTLAGNVSHLSVSSHPTHWLLCSRFHGFSKKEDNGFMVAGWAKGIYPQSKVEEEVNRYILNSGAEFRAEARFKNK